MLWENCYQVICFGSHLTKLRIVCMRSRIHVQRVKLTPSEETPYGICITCSRFGTLAVMNKVCFSPNLHFEQNTFLMNVIKTNSCLNWTILLCFNLLSSFSDFGNLISIDTLYTCMQSFARNKVDWGSTRDPIEESSWENSQLFWAWLSMSARGFYHTYLCRRKTYLLRVNTGLNRTQSHNRHVGRYAHTCCFD